ncbi:MAG: hypothetical protein QXO40_03430 [Candidatus Aenigmatarchaeota archaeon]
MIGKILSLFLFFIGIVFANFYPGECFILDGKEFCIPHNASAGNYTLNYTIEVYVKKDYYLIPAPYENETKINYFKNETYKLIEQLIEKDRKIAELENKIKELELELNESKNITIEEKIVEKIVEKEKPVIPKSILIIFTLLIIIILYLLWKIVKKH